MVQHLRDRRVGRRTAADKAREQRVGSVSFNEFLLRFVRPAEPASNDPRRPGFASFPMRPAARALHFERQWRRLRAALSRDGLLRRSVIALGGGGISE